MTKKALLIQLEENEHQEFKQAIQSHNSKPMAARLNMRAIVRDAIIKFIKKNKKEHEK